VIPHIRSQIRGSLQPNFGSGRSRKGKIMSTGWFEIS
jgi:hypothetical protein